MINKYIISRLILGILVFILISCASNNIPEENNIISGKGSFIFDKYDPLKEKPLNVWFYNPENSFENASNLPVLILMHGNSRAAESYLDAMVLYADEYKFLLIVPEFSKEYFPSSRDYHQGGVLTKEGEPVDEKYWAFSLIEPLFDYVRKVTKNPKENYYLYGFSAGSQFVHRFMMHKPDNRASSVLAASAGTYTMPDYDENYSYGIKNSIITPGDMQKFLSRDLKLMVGEADTVLNRSDLVKTTGANRQGRDRVKRGQKFFDQSKEMAQTLGVPFNWEFEIVPGVGHSQKRMAGSAAKRLFGQE